MGEVQEFEETIDEWIETSNATDDLPRLMMLTIFACDEKLDENKECECYRFLKVYTRKLLEQPDTTQGER